MLHHCGVQVCPLVSQVEKRVTSDEAVTSFVSAGKRAFTSNLVLKLRSDALA